MPYEFLDDIAIADIAFHAWGNDLPELFQAAGDAVMNTMIENLEAIELRETRVFDLENDALDMLLFNFLEEFVYYKDSQQLLLRSQNISIKEKLGNFYLNATAQGEKLDSDRHHQGVDVKAVTLHRFKLEQTESGWEALVILDI